MKTPTTAVETTPFQVPADSILNTFVATDVLMKTIPTTTTDSKHVPTPADAILKNPFNTDAADPQDIASESEPPTPALHHPTNEELRVARAEKRAGKRAEKHANAEDLKKQVCVLVKFNPLFVRYLEISRAMSSSPQNSTRKHTYPTWKLHKSGPPTRLIGFYFVPHT
jgi:hypothetical protein